ncbi:MAG: threonine ammonia-lyase [Desulfobacterales bacterium]
MIPIAQFRQAAALIQDKILKTPLVNSPALSRMFGGEIYLKLENLQKTGSFKIRGATHKLLKCRDDIGAGGVVAASAGNHAQGVALAARQLGIPATIVMPEWVSISKEEATRMYGSRVIISGQSIGECLDEARRLSQQGLLFVHPFDDADVIAGQGSVGLEIFDQMPDAALVVVPVGGGGLISGIAAVARAVAADTQVIGVQTAVCPSAYDALMQGRITQVDGKSSIADGISVRQVGQLTFDIIKECVEELVLVEEEHIAAAILVLLEREKILAEGAGAAPLAALMNGAVGVPRGGKTVLVVSGGNVDSPLLGRIISQGLNKSGRVMRIHVRMADVPGSLARLLTLIADLKANVLHISHDRNLRGIPLYVTHVELEIETRGPAHVNEIETTLTRNGYDFKAR